MKKKTTKTDVYQLVTDRIIAELEKGRIPWRKQWSTAGMPSNLISKKPYRGINVMLLASLGYASNYFVTFKQARQLGGNVKKGERGCPVVFWKFFAEEDKETGKLTGKQIPMLRYYTVFNVDQCEGIDPAKIPTVEEDKNDNDPIEACEMIVKDMQQRPDIRHKEQRAYYQPAGDFVNMPKLETFKQSEDYYSVLFHELVHSTGHEDRLNRSEVTNTNFFGSHEYSKEELTAEIGACFVSSIAGIDQDFENSVAYIGGWLEKLKNDKKFIVYASGRAQKAADFILNIKHERGEE